MWILCVATCPCAYIYSVLYRASVNEYAAFFLQGLVRIVTGYQLLYMVASKSEPSLLAAEPSEKSIVRFDPMVPHTDDIST